MNELTSIPVLDKGYVELVEIFGNELTIVNAARVSFDKSKTELDEADIKLLRYLKKHKHFSPFRHLMFRFKIKAPEFVMRQLYKHVVGIEATAENAFKDTAWNEVSMRYKSLTDFYVPEVWRKQSKLNKQGSDGELSPDQQRVSSDLYNKTLTDMITCYNELLSNDVAREQARVLLPLSIYTSVSWCCSFQALANFIELRRESDSQYEIRKYADAMVEILKEKLPVLYDVWFE